jgi:hypothetical protein
MEPHKIAAAASGADSTNRDARRLAAWLLAPYSAPIWVVRDTTNITRKQKIDFRYRLSDGRLLTEAPSLYATVKEYAWWIRAPRFSRIDDATTHATMVNGLMHMAHALTLRDIYSFKLLMPFDIDQLVDECAFGADALIRASERVKRYLQSLPAASADDPHGGLPPYVRNRRYVHSAEVAKACHLPRGAAGYPRVAWEIARAAEIRGLTTRTSRDREIPPFRTVTVQAIQRWLDPLESLYEMRRVIEGDAIPFKPFPHSAARVAAVKGAATHRTPVPPPRLALHLLEHATKYLFEHSPAMITRNVHDIGADVPASRDRGRHLPPEDSESLAVACFVIITAFSARRYKEILGLEVGCLTGDEWAGWWLNVFIDKTLSRMEWIPVPSIVATSIKCLTIVSAGARTKTGSKILFQELQVREEIEHVTLFEPANHIDDFAALVGVPLHAPSSDAPPERWHWQPRQFRRFFAILYFYRYEGATLEALSHHLRHFNLEMTRRYVTTDPEVAAIWTDVEWGYTGDVARSIAAGERSVGGAMGDKLKKTALRLRDRFRRTLSVATPDRVGASLKLIMQRLGLVLTPKPWITCSCPKTRQAATMARCRTDPDSGTLGVGPDFARATPLTCSACPHAIVEKTRQPFINREVEHLELAAASPARAGTLVGAVERTRLVELSEVRERFGSAGALAPSASSIGRELTTEGGTQLEAI